MKSLLATLALGLIVSIGCSQSSGPDANASADADSGITKVSTTLCGGCGEVKGSESCCAADAEVCDCGLHKGSPGCCKIEKGTDVTLCSGCGEVKGSEKCCAEGAEVCSCGAHKGSPGCCLDKKTEAAEGTDGSGTKDDDEDEDEDDDEGDGSSTKAEEAVEEATGDAA